MIDLRVKGDVTKSRLMEAAERLIAEKGFDAVSVRDITGLAKANVAAVNYHFGSREGLLGALLEQRMKPIFADRAERLEALSDAATPRQLFEAWVQPLLFAAARDGMDEATHARVIGRCLEATFAGLHETTGTLGKVVDATMKRMLDARWGARDAITIAWRFHFAQGALIHAMIHGTAVHTEFRLARVLEQWVDAMVAQFSAADPVIARDAPVGKITKAVRKDPSSSPLRQIAEVVSAAMEVVEVTTGTSVIASPTDKQPQSTISQHVGSTDASAVVKKSPRSKKTKVVDDMEELFLL
ncbi:MAG: hypothetical protein RI957_283 [Verrucomicrobiota bacterium]|jgi:AcrR family transcriptional regulator